MVGVKVDSEFERMCNTYSVSKKISNLDHLKSLETYILLVILAS